MFDLESQITSWRESFNRQKVDEQTLTELESHLRDAYCRLHRGDIAPEQAWRQAVAELGDASVIASEFRKTRKPFGWWPNVAGIVLSACAIGVIALMLSRARGNPDWVLIIHVMAITTGYLSMFFVGLLAVCSIFQQLARRWDARRDAGFRAFGLKLSTLALICIAVGIPMGMIWSGSNLNAHWSWDPREVGGLFTFLWAVCLVLMFRSQRASTRLLFCAGLVADVITAHAWFGPAVLATRHQHGYDHVIGSGLLIFVVIHLVLAAGLIVLGRDRIDPIKAD
jgi:hypothetical protein